jgi:hypothetical protein
LGFGNGGESVYDDARRYGYSVRGVIGWLKY